jgi:hypothetical protein
LPFGNGRRLSLPLSDHVRQHQPDANASVVPEARPGHFLDEAALMGESKKVWRAAYEWAERRALPGEWPFITSYDFGKGKPPPEA